MWSSIDGNLKWNNQQFKDVLWIVHWDEETKKQADFGIMWYDLHADVLIPKLEVFEDSWLALYQYGQDFLKMLAENDNKNLTKEEMKSKLLELGFINKIINE